MATQPARMQSGHPGPLHIDLLVRAAQTGDQAAFEEVYRLHVGRVNAICRRILGDPAWAEDVVQDAFVRAWLMLPGFRHESSFGSWLYRLTVNIVLLELRSTKRRRNRVTTCEDVTQLGPSHTSEPDAVMDLEIAIAGLPEQARLVFVLHEVEGYQHDEIGEMLGVAVGTCKAQLHRARHLLRERLKR